MPTRQIAYVDEAGQVQLWDLDRGATLPVSTRGESCGWPSWSPDGTYLAWVRYESDGARIRAATIEIALPDGSERREVHRVQEGLPIYLNWSPNGRRLGLLVQQGQELALEIADVAGVEPPLTVAHGVPLYFAWQPDSHGLVAHTGSAPGEAGLLWIRAEGARAVSERIGARPAAGFRAPAWASQFRGMTVALDAGERARICVYERADSVSQELFECGPGPAFVWSPTGELLAFGERPTPGSPAYDRISIYRCADGTIEQVSAEPSSSFFWAPDGRRLVYTTPLVGDRSVGVRVLDLPSRAQRDLGFVRPSRDLLFVLGHFDQYSESARIVSPSGDELILAASRAKEQENGSVPTARQLLVRALAPDGPEQVLTRGTVGFWRPFTP